MIPLKITANNIFKGVFIGFGTMIPGVSGGTVAMLIGVFEDILESTANVFKHLRKSLVILFPILSGAVLGAYLISYPLEYFSVEFPQLSKSTFCIISIISAVYFAKINLKGSKNAKTIVCFLLGTLIAFTSSILFRFYDISAIEFNFINLFFMGTSLSLALVLPAISFSYMLLFFGIYDSFIKAIISVDIYFLLPIFLGVSIGSYLFSKFLLKLINHHTVATYSFVYGFVLYSAVDIFI